MKRTQERGWEGGGETENDFAKGEERKKERTRTHTLEYVYVYSPCAHSCAAIGKFFDKADDYELFNWLIPPVSRLRIGKGSAREREPSSLSDFRLRLFSLLSPSNARAHTHPSRKKKTRAKFIMDSGPAGAFNWKPKKRAEQRELVKTALIYIGEGPVLFLWASARFREKFRGRGVMRAREGIARGVWFTAARRARGHEFDHIVKRWLGACVLRFFTISIARFNSAEGSFLSPFDARARSRCSARRALRIAIGLRVFAALWDHVILKR